ncbi:MAG: lipopolysaccharide kinase InaA family protein [Acidobacteriota bacterium]
MAAPPASAVADFGEPFEVEGFEGRVASAYQPADLAATVAHALDPAAAIETLHWGRNYLYRTLFETADGSVEVVVKQFRNASRRQRLDRRIKGSKAERSWRTAVAFGAAGLLTPEPVLLAESKRPDGPSFYLCRYLGEVVEARYFFRARNVGEEGQEFPHLDPEAVLTGLGQSLRRMHDAGFLHRDMSSGNVLIEPRRGDGEGPNLAFHIIDLNRTRRLASLSDRQRSRDLSRLMIFRPEDQRRFLDAYWGPASERQRNLYQRYHRGFLNKNRIKKQVRGRLRGLTQWLRDLVLPRHAHAHIPNVPEGTETREKVVWDRLSDQPHQHAGKLEKLGTRMADFPQHAAELAAAAGALPAARKRYRELTADLYQSPAPWPGAGICLRPWPEDPEALLTAVDELGVRQILLRLHPWQEDHGDEESLARELAQRGYELTFALPQNRELVRDPERWRHAIEELAERFRPFGSTFQIGQAINRSKWGVWNLREYFELAETAAGILRRRPGTQILGPGVIDFELHATAAALNWRHTDLCFDAMASLLYVDRRGAPENRQVGFDTVGKVTLLKAIAETARNCRGRSWITEVNWPLWEGPHSPAGRSVSVSEEVQAHYLTRYFLLAFGTGLVERIFWWQLVARGYGLTTEEDGVLRRRPSFHALAFLERELRHGQLVGPLEVAPPARAILYRNGGGDAGLIAWSTEGEVEVELPGVGGVGRDLTGREVKLPSPGRARLGPGPSFYPFEA